MAHFCFLLSIPGEAQSFISQAMEEAMSILGSGLESHALKDIYVQITERNPGPCAMRQGPQILYCSQLF